MSTRKKKLPIIILLLVMIVLAIIASTVILIKKNAALYPYQVKQDYDYDNHQANLINLTLSNGEIVLPHDFDFENSNFLKIKIESSLAGKFLQPSIDVNLGKGSLTQYFEHGAKGVRYINISSLEPTAKPIIKLNGEHISFENQTVQLVSYNNLHLQGLKILVLAPHPDDAEIAAYGLYSDTKDPYIATVTAGDAGNYKYDELYKATNVAPAEAVFNAKHHYLKKGKLRTWNSITVPLLADVKKDYVINLGFFDSTLSEMFKNKSEAVSGVFTKTSDIDTFRKQNISKLSTGLSGDSSWHSLVKNLSYLLKEIEPDVIVTPYPAIDNHDDHKLSTVALFEALKASNISDGHLFLYSNHFTASEYFPFGKSNGTISLPPSFEKKLHFDSIYSHPLPYNKQIDKTFALEAMHDLRPDTEWRYLGGSLRNLLKVIVKNTLGLDNSYYKRAVRSNELFFVVKTSDIYDEEIYNKLVGEINLE